MKSVCFTVVFMSFLNNSGFDYLCVEKTFEEQELDPQN